MGAAFVLVLIGFGVLALGILVGRYYVPDDRSLKRTARHSRAYMRTVNHLLARDKDAAVDELRKVVEETTSDVEPYFALGALFRSRGEWERAVRVHQAIELRPDIKKKVRQRALYELGLDFRAAGMPRRATKAMEQCLADDNMHEGTLRALCGLYEEQRYYADAADAWARLEKIRIPPSPQDDRRRGEPPRPEGGKPPGEVSPREAHLWAAAAHQAIEAGDTDAARRHLKRAERCGADNPHVVATAAQLAAAKGNPRGAAKQLRRALAQNPELAAYFVPALEEAERQQLLIDQGVIDERDLDDERREELRRLVADRAGRALDAVMEDVGPQPMLQLARAKLRAESDLQGALEELRLVLSKDPTLLAARVSASRLVLALGEDEAAKDELAALMAPGGTLARLTEGVWQCGSCGRFETEFFWRCDQCRQWGSATYDTDRTQSGDRSRLRERRSLPRATDRPAHALPSADPSEVGKPGLVGRAGSWISGTWTGIRGGKPHSKQLPPGDDSRLGD